MRMKLSSCSGSLPSLVVAFALSCRSSALPPLDSVPQYLRSSGVDRPAISIDIRADKPAVNAGDTIHFVLIARNASAERVQIGVQCGPAMDIRMDGPRGRTVSVLNTQFEDEKLTVAFTCELGPYHFADARDSLINRLWWKAPRQPGEYTAVAGARGEQGLDDVSTPLTVRVF
jgi:hypothetical protein